MQTDKLIHEELTYKIIGILYKVHKKLGCGFPEKIYQRAIEIELKTENIPYEIEKEFEVRYDGELWYAKIRVHQNRKEQICLNRWPSVCIYSPHESF